MMEACAIIGGALHAAEHLEEWTKPEKSNVEVWKSSWGSTIYKEPKGVVLIIGPWNYPFILTLGPLLALSLQAVPAL
ncbi:hypothetical protein AcV5_000137 [Taiwanofungus camphoratus]|nr:hypothetical protein AcV5_000137 [Antrodia cinnamomea]KAI0945021.1 hypothetical protein AcV7_001667 [Antrodia cinnamomea]